MLILLILLIAIVVVVVFIFSFDMILPKTVHLQPQHSMLTYITLIQNKPNYCMVVQLALTLSNQYEMMNQYQTCYACETIALLEIQIPLYQLVR